MFGYICIYAMFGNDCSCCHDHDRLLVFFQLQEDELRESVVLVFANKQDLPNAKTSAELTEALGLNSLRRDVSSCHVYHSLLDL